MSLFIFVILSFVVVYLYMIVTYNKLCKIPAINYSSCPILRQFAVADLGIDGRGAPGLWTLPHIGGLWAVPPAGMQGAEPPLGGLGQSPQKLKPRLRIL